MREAAARIAPPTAVEGFEFQAIRVGCVAADTLSTARAGRVIAVFDRGFYIQFDGDLVFLGNADLASGPLNLVTSSPVSANWKAAGVRVGDQVSHFAGRLIVPPRFRFTVDHPPVWRPERVTENLKADDVARGLAGFREAAAGRLPREGLARSIWDESDLGVAGRVVEAARPCVGDLRDWMTLAFQDRGVACPAAVTTLIGLGPGLTPSGDDLLGGAMIAAQVMEESSVAHRLWERIQPRLDATGVISRAHLRAAAGGLGHEVIHRALTAMLTGQTDGYGALIDEIDRIGHSSGWDAIAGVVPALEAWLVSRSSP